MVPRHFYAPTTMQRFELREAQAKLRATVAISRARRPAQSAAIKPLVIGSKVLG